MTDPTNPGDIVVIGQRRRPGGSFPPPSGSGGGPGEDGGIHQNEVGQEPEDTVSPPDPCADPDTRKIWDADARAAAAVSDLAAKAVSLNDGSSLSNREFGANLFLNSVGQVELSPVSVGPTPYSGTIPEVTIEPGGTTYLNWMGDIHNHPSGDGRPSGAEWSRFLNRIDAIQNLHPQRSEMVNVSMYVVARDPQTGQDRIYAYKKGDDPDQLGMEVNPQGQACPIV
jgi:hypothetical protein